MFGLQNVQPTSRNSAAHLSTKQDDFTSIFSKALILKEILCRSVAKTEKWTTLVHFSNDFTSFDIVERRVVRRNPAQHGRFDEQIAIAATGFELCAGVQGLGNHASQ
jgi:hypothetical protein